MAAMLVIEQTALPAFSHAGIVSRSRDRRSDVRKVRIHCVVPCGLIDALHADDALRLNRGTDRSRSHAQSAGLPNGSPARAAMAEMASSLTARLRGGSKFFDV